MNDNPITVREVSPAEGLVPSGYAEKTMASLLQLHGELMEEKERRVDLYRRLMEKEQAIAELKMYVKLLEEKAKAAEARAQPPPAPRPVAPPPPQREVQAQPAAGQSGVRGSGFVARPMQVSPPARPEAQPLPNASAAPIPGPAFPQTRPTPKVQAAPRPAPVPPGMAARKVDDGWKTW